MHYYIEVHRFILIPEGVQMDSEIPEGVFLWLNQKELTSGYTFVKGKKLFSTLKEITDSFKSMDGIFHKPVNPKAAIIKINVEGDKITEICSIYLPSNLAQEIFISDLVQDDALDKINQLSLLSMIGVAGGYKL